MNKKTTKDNTKKKQFISILKTTEEKQIKSIRLPSFRLALIS